MKKILLPIFLFALAMSVQAQFFNRLIRSARSNAEEAIQQKEEKKQAEIDSLMLAGRYISYEIFFDEYSFTPESQAEIERIVKVMQAHPELGVIVQCHTDSLGDAHSDLLLTEQRARGLLVHLVEAGISADRLVAAGRGHDEPLADETADEGRAKNRRVEFIKR